MSIDIVSSGGLTNPSLSSDEEEVRSGTSAGMRRGLDDLRDFANDWAIAEVDGDEGGRYVRPGHPLSGSLHVLGETTMGERS